MQTHIRRLQSGSRILLSEVVTSSNLCLGVVLGYLFLATKNSSLIKFYFLFGTLVVIVSVNGPKQSDGSQMSIGLGRYHPQHSSADILNSKYSDICQNTTTKQIKLALDFGIQKTFCL